MLNRRKHHASAHQGRGITAVRYRLDGGWNFKSTEVGAAKNVTCVGWRGDESNVNRHRGVKSNAVGFNS
jgi:hypothetical protein